jgi:hypothetical protein
MNDDYGGYEIFFKLKEIFSSKLFNYTWMRLCVCKGGVVV